MHGSAHVQGCPESFPAVPAYVTGWIAARDGLAYPLLEQAKPTVVVDWWTEGIQRLRSLVTALDEGEPTVDIEREAKAWLAEVPAMRARYGPGIAHVGGFVPDGFEV